MGWETQPRGAVCSSLSSVRDLYSGEDWSLDFTAEKNFRGSHNEAELELSKRFSSSFKYEVSREVLRERTRHTQVWGEFLKRARIKPLTNNHTLEDGF